MFHSVKSLREAAVRLSTAAERLETTLEGLPSFEKMETLVVEAEDVV